MRKILLFTFFSLALVAAVTAQSTSDTFVVIEGKLLKAADSTPLVGKIRYEKLPYYDDMGTVSTGTDGTFSMKLIQGLSYNLAVTKEGYKKFKEELSITGPMVFDVYLSGDVIELIKLENLIFARGDDQINAISFQELDDLATYLISNPTLIIQLEGHTDFAGNPDSNLRLSEARVTAVKEYLVSKKVKKNRIFTKAFGGTKPLTQDRTDEAKSMNRRVEVRFIRR